MVACSLSLSLEVAISFSLSDDECEGVIIVGEEELLGWTMLLHVAAVVLAESCDAQVAQHQRQGVRLQRRPRRQRRLLRSRRSDRRTFHHQPPITYNLQFCSPFFFCLHLYLYHRFSIYMNSATVIIVSTRFSAFGGFWFRAWMCVCLRIFLVFCVCRILWMEGRTAVSGWPEGGWGWQWFYG